MDRWLKLGPQFPGDFANCTKCAKGFRIPRNFAEVYFGGQMGKCNDCGEVLDWWKIILKQVRNCPPYIYDSFAALGIVFERRVGRLGPDQHYIEFKPTEILPTIKTAAITVTDRRGLWPPAMLPSGATNANILNVMYKEKTGKFSIAEEHGEVPSRRVIPDIMRLHLIPIDQATGEEALVDIYVAWVPKRDEQAWQNLYEAFEYYTYELYDRAVIPANVAVELKPKVRIVQ